MIALGGKRARSVFPRCVCIHICIYRTGYISRMSIRVVGFFVEARPARGVKQTRAGYSSRASGRFQQNSRAWVFRAAEVSKFQRNLENAHEEGAKTGKNWARGGAKTGQNWARGGAQGRRRAWSGRGGSPGSCPCARGTARTRERVSFFFGGRSLGLLLRCLFWSAAHLNSTIANSIVAQCRRLLS